MSIGIDGIEYFPGLLDRPEQERLIEVLREAVRMAPFFTPVMPRTGRPFSVKMTNLGPLGWVSDRAGYRYQAHHPETGKPWPAIPQALLDIWAGVSGYPHPPQACLVNYYDTNAKMGLHQDRDEQALDAPVVSLSLGDSALFRIGGTTRKAPTSSLTLSSGDVIVLGGTSRLRYHGIDRIRPGTSTVLGKPGRLNLTMRRVTHPQDSSEESG